LDEVALKSGERMEIGVVECPDPDWAAQIVPLLGHKGQPWSHHVQAALNGPLDGLETRFYVGTIDGRAATNVMIVGARRGSARSAKAAETAAADRAGDAEPGADAVGILGHVYTVPEHRRKGAYSHLMAVQMEHTRRLGYRVLTLGTGFETPPYWIYHSFGFRSIDGTSGRMKWLADPAAEADWFRPGAAAARPLRWDDWAPLNLVAYHPAEADEELPRSWTFRLPRGQGSIEGSFLDLRRALPDQTPDTLADLHHAVAAGTGGGRPVALALESEHGAAVGWAVLQPDDLALRDGWRLDLFVHPAFRAHTGRLLAALPSLPGARSAAYTGGPEGYRAAALQAAGFAHVAMLPDWLRRDDRRAPLHVYARTAGA
jgi:GNAT superfamily N-acetyltransferase